MPVPPFFHEPRSLAGEGRGNSTASLTGRGAAPPQLSSVESPCIKVCQLDAQQQCRGCGRTIDEITGWRTMSDEERRAINARVGFRGHPR